MRFFRQCIALTLVGACFGAQGCSSDQEEVAATPEEIEATLQSRLQNDTGVPWKVHVDRRSHEVRFLAPETPVSLPGASLEEKARTFLAAYADELHTSPSDTLLASEEQTDPLGQKTVRFDHRLAGSDIPILDVTSVARVRGGGERQARNVT